MKEMLFAPLTHVQTGLVTVKEGTAVVPNVKPTMLMLPGANVGITAKVPPTEVGVTPLKLVKAVAVFTSPVLVAKPPASEMPPVIVTAWAADAAIRHPRSTREDLIFEIFMKGKIAGTPDI